MKKALLFLFVAVLMLSVQGFAQNNCNAPSSLTASLHAPEWNNVLLNWNAAVDSTQQDIMWSTTTYSTRIGGGEDVALDFTGAIRFTPTELATHSGQYLTSVSFIPGESQTVCTYYVMVWQGGSVTNDTMGMSFRWIIFDENGNIVSTSDKANPDLRFENEGHYTVRLVVITDEGCTDSIALG